MKGILLNIPGPGYVLLYDSDALSDEGFGPMFPFKKLEKLTVHDFSGGIAKEFLCSLRQTPSLQCLYMLEFPEHRVPPKSPDIECQW